MRCRAAATSLCFSATMRSSMVSMRSARPGSGVLSYTAEGGGIVTLWQEIRLTVLVFGAVGLAAAVAVAVLYRRGVGRLLPLPHLKAGYWYGAAALGHFLLLKLSGPL